MSIVSGKRWRYIMEGNVPVNVPPELLEGAIHSSVTWTGNMLPHLTGARVELIDDTPDDAKAGRILRVN